MKEKFDIGTKVWVVLDDTLQPELVKGTIKGVSDDRGDYKYCIEFGDLFTVTGTSNIFTTEACALQRYSERLEMYISILIGEAQEIVTNLQRKQEQINEAEEKLIQCLKQRCNKLINK